MCYLSLADPVLGACHRPAKTDFENEKYIIILYLFCTILFTKSQILYTVPSCAIGNSNLGGWWHAAPPQMQFQHKKLVNNFVLILYSFVHQVPNFVHASFLRYGQFKFGGVGDMHPPKCSFNIKNWIIILYSFYTILYTKSQILYTIPSCTIGNSNLGDWWNAALPNAI